MTKSILIGAVLASVAATALPAALGAQVEVTAQRQRRCTVVPDSVPGPTPGQIAERLQLRDQLQAVFRAHGQTPAGLLYVDVDSTRHGQVRFLDVELPDSTIQAATRHVAEYLRSLPRGRGYQALIRIDGDYPALSPGKRHCVAEYDNPGEVAEASHRMMSRHPLTGRLREPVPRRTTVLLVVSREGRVVHAEVATPSGDDFIDANVTEVAYAMRFLPALLDGQPIDTRFRFNLSFNVR